MNKKKELAKNTIIILIGKTCTQFISFFLLPLYTSVLNTSDYGVVDLLTTYITFLVPIITLQLEQAVFRRLVDERNNPDAKKLTITNAVYCVIIQIFLALIVFVIITRIVEIQYMYYVCFSVIAMIFASLSLQSARGLGDNIGYAIGSIISGSCTIVFNLCFLLVLKMGAPAMLLSSALANLMCTLFLFVREKHYKNISVKYIDKKIVGEMLKYSLPLVPNGIVWWIINASDRTVIAIFLGTSANGVYAVANKFSGMFINIYNIFNLSWTESAAVHINDNDRDTFFSDTINSILQLFSSAAIGIIAVMPFVFPFFVDAQFQESYNYIPLLLLGTLFNVFVGLISTVYIAKKLTKKIAQTSFWAGIINIVTNVLMVNYIGIYASVISTIIAFATMAIYRYFDVRKYIKLIIKKSLIFSVAIIFSVVTICYYINNFYLNILMLIIVVIYAICSNKDFLLGALNMIKDVILHGKTNAALKKNVD